MSELTALRPKLKQDSVFLQTREGVFLQGDEAAFVLKGSSVYRWVSTLSPYMTGEYTLGELCQALEPSQQETVTRLVEALLQRGMVKNHIPEDPELLPEPVLSRFRSQIELIDHYVDRPIERFKKFRESRILLVGSGESFMALATSLLHNGVKGIFLAPSVEANTYLSALEPEVNKLHQIGIEAYIRQVNFDPHSSSEGNHTYDILAYCSDNSSFKDILALQQYCFDQGYLFLPSAIHAGQAFLGPIVNPHDGPCWLCAQMRLAANAEGEQSAALWKALAIGEDLGGQDTPLFTPMARRLGNGLGFELFKMITEHLPADTARGIIVQDLETLESYFAKLIRHPLCPICSRFNHDSLEQRTREIATGQHDREAISRENLFERTDQLIDERTGMFHGFVDDTLTQVPLKVSRIRVASSAAMLKGFQVTAFDTETPMDARVNACIEAVHRYANSLPDKRKMVEASYNELVESGKSVVAPQRLTTWSGAFSFDPDSQYAWLPALSQFTQDFYYVPAAAVYPCSPLNRTYLFERTLAGSAAHTSFQGLLTSGMISALASEHLRTLMQGHRQVVKLDLNALHGLDNTLTFLLKIAEHFERSYALLEVLTGSPLHIVLAYTTDSSVDQLSCFGAGLSGCEAAKQALIKLVGNLQLLKYEGAAADCSEEPAPLFSLRYGDPGTSRFKQPASTFQTLEAHLYENELDTLFVDTTTLDVHDSNSFITGRILILHNR